MATGPVPAISGLMQTEDISGRDIIYKPTIYKNFLWQSRYLYFCPFTKDENYHFQDMGPKVMPALGLRKAYDQL